jgi:putative PIG3 family NAD(P)H quinone oxidoreductase
MVQEVLKTGVPDTIPETMACVEIAAPGGPEALRPARRPVPRPGPGEVLIRVAAAGINRPDVLQRQGKYPPPPGASDLPGLEVSGTIVALGADVADLGVGDAVCALLAGGGYAEYCLAPAPQCLPVPAGLDLVSAAGLPETFFTVWTNVFERGRLVAGETLLVHGGGSGIGTAAIALARAMGARVIATAGSAGKCAACERLGAERAVNYREEDFVAVVGQLTAGRGVDLVLDMVGGDYLPRNLACLAPDGRLVQIALLRGAHGELDLGRLMRQRLTVTGSTLRVRPVEEKGRIARALCERVWPLLAAGRVWPVIDSRFPLEQAAEAHRRMESGAHFGKILLSVDPRPLTTPGPSDNFGGRHP